MALKVLFFDAAGTLIQPAETVGLTYSRIAKDHGVTASGEDLSRAFRAAWKALPPPEHPVGMPPIDDDRGWWRRLVAAAFEIALDRPLAEAVIDPLFDELYGHYSSRLAWEVYADVLPALLDLGRDHRLIVVSNFDRRLRAIMEGHDLLRHFERVIISSEVGASKPHARMFQAALVASYHNPVLKAFADRLRAAGKPHKVVITAVARKLVTIANALCKSRLTWTNQGT